MSVRPRNIALFAVLCCGFAFLLCLAPMRLALANTTYAEDEVLVVYDKGSDATNTTLPTESNKTMEKAGFEVVEELPTTATDNTGDAVVAQIPTSMSVEEAVTKLESADGVALVQPNYVYRLDEDVVDESQEENLFDALARINDTLYTGNTSHFANLTMHKLLNAWDLAKTNHSVAVAVIDTGCRLTHNDLVANIDKNNAWDFSEDKNQPLTTSVAQNSVGSNGDENGHGTHVCGIIAAEANNAKGLAGASYNATVIPINVFEKFQEDDGSWSWGAYTSSIWRALDKVAKMHEAMPELKVVNMSLGGEGPDTVMNRQITKLANMGVLCVCAAGNEDSTQESVPADCTDSLRVMALNKDGRHTYYTNYKTGRQINVANTVSAMGGGGSGNSDKVLSTYNLNDESYARLVGTSQATPLVAGVASLVWAANPSLTVSEVKSVLTSTASPVNSQSNGMSYKDAASAGSVDAYEAVLAAKGMSLTKVASPEAAQGLVYDGMEQVGVADGDGYTLRGTVAATAAGTYTATASLDDPTTSRWSDNSTADKTITWSISPAELTATYADATIRVGETVPAAVEVSGFVNGESASTAAGYVAPTANTSGVNTRAPGKYDVTLSGGKAKNYTFAYQNGSVVVMGAVSVPSGTSGLVYTGKEQTGVPGTSAYTVEGGSATDAGTHTATATLSAYYTWSDGSTNSKQVEWSIRPATLSARYVGGRIHMGDAAPNKVEVLGFVNGESASTAAGYVAPTATITDAQRTTVGTYTISPSGGKATNYEFSYQSGVLYVTDKLVVDAPVANDGLVYNGSVQVGVGVRSGGTIAAVPSSVGYTVTNAKATNAGTYTAVATLADGYVWSDGSDSNKTYTWKIASAELTATYKGGTMWAGGAAPTSVEVTGFKNGESAATVTGYRAPTVNVTSAQRMTPGVYTVAPTGGNAANYTFKYQAGKLSVFGKAVAPVGKSLAYNGSRQTGVAAGTGYTLSGTVSATNAGAYTAKATLRSNYKWSDGSTAVRYLSWKISALDVSKATVVAIGNQPYTGKAICPKPLVSLGGKTLSASTDYTLSYRNNVQAGTATVVVTGRGNYAGTKSATFRIVAPSVSYRTHVQNVGWQAWRTNGRMSGTSGRGLRLEGINIKLGGMPASGGIQYRTHIQNIGWQGWRSNGAMSGTSGRGLRLEAIEIRLTGRMSQLYDVYYRVHAQNVGWMGWAKNGVRSGTAGFGYRLEGIQVVLVPKGAKAPAATYLGIRQANSRPFRQR